MSVNESFYDEKVGATQTDPDLALRLNDELSPNSPMHDLIVNRLRVITQVIG